VKLTQGFKSKASSIEVYKVSWTNDPDSFPIYCFGQTGSYVAAPDGL